MEDTSNMEQQTIGREIALSILESWRTNGRNATVKGFRVGPNMVCPASEQGLADLETVRKEVLETVQTPLAKCGELYAALAKGLDSLGFGPARADGYVRDRDRAKGPGEGLSFALNIPYSLGLGLPTGEDLPEPLLGKALLGFTVDDGEDLISSMGACSAGSIDWLEQHGIEYEAEREGGCCCGEDCHGDEEMGGISYVESFELTQDMIDSIDAEGYLEAFQKATGCADRTMSSMDEDGEDFPGVSGDVYWDTSKWDFAPDYSALFDTDEDDDEDTIFAMLPKLASLLESYRSENLMPPIPGRIFPKGTESSAGFQWDPTDGTFTRFGHVKDGVLPSAAYVRGIDGENTVKVQGRTYGGTVIVGHWELPTGLRSLASLSGFQMTIC